MQVWPSCRPGPYRRSLSNFRNALYLKLKNKIICSSCPENENDTEHENDIYFDNKEEIEDFSDNDNKEDWYNDVDKTNDKILDSLNQNNNQ